MLWGALLWVLVNALCFPTRTKEAKLIGTTPVELSQPDVWQRLRAVESAGNPLVVSPAGACGLYQIMPATWADMTDIPFEECTDASTNMMVAKMYWEWLTATLTTWRSSVPSESDLLACWNGGIGRYRRCEYKLECMPAETRTFVERVR